jgi:hypothetical protein
VAGIQSASIQEACRVKVVLVGYSDVWGVIDEAKSIEDAAEQFIASRVKVGRLPPGRHYVDVNGVRVRVESERVVRVTGQQVGRYATYPVIGHGDKWAFVCSDGEFSCAYDCREAAEYARRDYWGGP